MSNIVFNHIKKNNIIIPEEYEINDNKIYGLFLSSSIRFYKENLVDQLAKINKNDKNFRRIKRRIMTNFGDFEVKDNKVILGSSRMSLEKDYNYSNGIIYVKKDYCFDIVPIEDLDKYLTDNEYDIGIEEILSSKTYSYVEKENKKIKSLNLK